MANIFKFINYNKVGKGVEKNLGKSPFKLFFELYFRKFWGLVRLNMLYFLFNIPALVIAVYVLPRYYMTLFKGTPLLNNIEKSPIQVLFISLILGAIFVGSQMVVFGPATAGFTYVLRNYSREQHAFVWSDFKEAALANFKQSIYISLFDFFTLFVIGFDISVYVNTYAGRANSLVSIIALTLLIIFGLIYLMMHIYIYPILVTFKSKNRDVFKNALIFSMKNFLPNLLIIIACFAIILATFIYTPAGFVLFPLITLSTLGFITNFYANRQLLKFTETDPNAFDQNKDITV